MRFLFSVDTFPRLPRRAGYFPEVVGDGGRVGVEPSGQTQERRLTTGLPRSVVAPSQQNAQ